MAGFDGIPRRYVCSAKYTEGSDTRYLIREVTSTKMGDGLREAVINLFVSDLVGEGGTNQASPSENEGKARQMTRAYMTGKLTDLSIDELKEKSTSLRKENH